MDWENIYGSGAGDNFADCACGSPIPAGTADKTDQRYETYLTISHDLDPVNRVALEMSYGKQKNSALASFANKKDAAWYGANFSFHHQLTETLSWNNRAEWFYTDAPSHVVMANIDPGTGIPDPSWGSFYAMTTNLSWLPKPNLRLRPEARYDIHSGPGRDAFGNGSRDAQLVLSFDATVFF